MSLFCSEPSDNSEGFPREETMTDEYGRVRRKAMFEDEVEDEEDSDEEEEEEDSDIESEEEESPGKDRLQTKHKAKLAKKHKVVRYDIFMFMLMGH